MNLGTLADERGRYLLIVPASRVRPGQSVQVTVSLIGRTSQTRIRDAPAGYDES